MGKKSRKKTESASEMMPEVSGKLGIHRQLFERVLFFLALFGVLVAIHLNIQQGRGFDRGCLGFTMSEAVEATFDCEAVTTSSASQLFGVSNAIWGLLFYLAVVAMGIGIAFLPARRVLLKKVRLVSLGVGFLYSLYLSYTQYFVLNDLCALCLISATVVLLLCITQVLYLFQPEDLSAQHLVFAGDKKLYGALAVGLVVLAVVDITYFNSLGKPIPPMANQPTEAVEIPTENINYEAVCVFDTEKPYYSNFDRLIDGEDIVYGNKAAEVTMVEYFDPNCPHCKVLHPVMETLANKYSDRMRFVYKPVVIVGTHSLPQVTALQLANREGKFFEMLNYQFAYQNARVGLSPKELTDAAKGMGMDADAFRTNLSDKDLAARNRRESRTFQDLGLTGVPTLIMNGRVIASRARTIGCLNYMIQRELGEVTPADTTTSVPVEETTGE